MIRHVILWKLRDIPDDGTSAEADEVKRKLALCEEGFSRLVGRIPGLLSLKLYTKPLLSSSCDLMLDAKFEDEAALAAYKSNPEHQAIQSVLRPLVSERVCMDCEEPNT
ncbi:MAG: Dabb family protein [Firmicutes bacterium]|nr:Dabb family protein [Bacillota bacterium]MCD7944937.1 Dabb family protein [Clostridia bacterium]MCD7748018.1 Dabb family protein [Bacillota bacterium]MCD7782826.1 Dabb family protein [Bacillota bacterium]MCD7788371.1 Dabb family protein [Bacillota bacterium]